MEISLSAEQAHGPRQTRGARRSGHSGSSNARTHSRTATRDQPNNNNPLKYKKKRRRRRQSRKGDGSRPNGRGSLDSSGGSGGGPSCSKAPSGGHRVPRSRAPSTPAGPPMPLLRPVGSAVPRAPENSTTFIMDDHENSNLFYNFRNDDFSTPHWAKPTPLNSDDEDVSSNAASAASSTYSTPARGPAAGDAPAPAARRTLSLGDGTPTYGGGSATPTHHSSWYPFNVEDFESAYQTAREDRLMAGSHKDLRQAIAKLEARAAVLHDALSASPSHILQRLQTQLLQLQEDNRSLRATRRPRQQSTDRSSSSSSSDSDSDSDSSDCSESGCDTCQQRRTRALREEEKENTCPKENICPDDNTCPEEATSTTDPLTEGTQ